LKAQKDLFSRSASSLLSLPVLLFRAHCAPYFEAPTTAIAFSAPSSRLQVAVFSSLHPLDASFLRLSAEVPLDIKSNGISFVGRLLQMIQPW
jgi:hypothetical protein